MPDPFIEKAWDELYRTGQISVPWKTSFPVPKQSAALRQPNKGPYQAKFIIVGLTLFLENGAPKQYGHQGWI